jgi:acetyl esterase/lipase
MTSEQVEKLVDLWHQYFSGAHDLMDRRAAFESFMATTPEPTRVQTRHVDADGVPADLILPARLHYSPGHRAILFVHGGGFYGGSLRTHRNVASALAKAASADVLLIDYRRVPEAIYPRQIQDTLTAYRWLLEQGYLSENISIVGDSVGGNLAIEMVLRQMQAKEPPPASVVVMSPVIDLAATGSSIDENADGDPLISRGYLELFSKAYLGNTSPDDPGRLKGSPARRQPAPRPQGGAGACARHPRDLARHGSSVAAVSLLGARRAAVERQRGGLHRRPFRRALIVSGRRIETFVFRNSGTASRFSWNCASAVLPVAAMAASCCAAAPVSS